MSDTVTNILEANDGDRMKAAAALVRELMAGDPSQHKAGYTRENAIIAAAKFLDMPRCSVEEMVA